MSLVLLVDDEPAVLEVLSQVVEDLGHQVLQAHDGDEALVLARSRRPQLVITDHMMPRLSGLELVRELARDDSLRAVPVIMMSAVLPGGAAEGHAFLPKPFEISDFERAVDQALAQAPSAPAAAGSPAPDVPALGAWVARSLERPLREARSLLQQGASGGASADVVRGLEAPLQALEGLAYWLPEVARLSTGALALERAEGDLGALVPSAVERWRTRHGGRPLPEVRVRLPDAPVRGHFDAQRLGQLLCALLMHAARRSGLGEAVQVELMSSRGLATLRVADAGAPIPPEELARLFEPFRAGEGAASGALELYVAAEIARIHGGGLSAEAAAPRGMAFSVVLPCAA